MAHRRSRAARIGRVAVHAVLMVGSLLMVMPMLWMIATSFKPPREIALWPAGLPPAVLRWGPLLMGIPMLWMIATSFKPPTEIALWPPHFLPQVPTFENYTGAF